MAEKRHPIISVHDEYIILPDKTAKCTRTYTFTNNHSIPIEIITREYIETFDIKTCNHEIEDAPAGKRKLDLKVDGFNKICYWKPSRIELKPKKSHEVKIFYDWPDFIIATDEQSSLIISYNQKKKVVYSLKIVPNKKDFFHGMSCEVKLDDSTHQPSILENGELLLGPLEVSSISPQFTFKLFIEPPIDIDKKLPLLQYFGSLVTGKPFKDYIIIMVQHLLGDFIPFINTLEGCGANNKKCFIIGIPYSTKDYVVKVLKQKKDFKNISAPKEYPFMDEVERVLTRVINECKKSDTKFLVIEDGGYIVPLLHKKEFRNGLKYCIGAVEQTANGIWRDKELAKEKKLKIPIMNVAESDLKKRLEGKLIGKAVVRNIERLLDKHYGEGIFFKNCLVNGLGSVGLNIALALKDSGAIVCGFDTSKQKMEVAKKKGIKIGEKVSELIIEQSIVIGGTGRSPISFNEISSSQHNTVFINATSKKEEIDYRQLNALTDTKEKIEGLGLKHHLTTGKTILLLAEGYPVNFYDSESIPNHEIQFVPTLLFKASILLLEKKFTEPKVYAIPKEIQKEIEEKYKIMRKSPIKI